MPKKKKTKLLRKHLKKRKRIKRNEKIVLKLKMKEMILEEYSLICV